MRGMTIGNLLAASLLVEGLGDFERVIFRESVDLRRAQFQHLTLYEVKWPEGPQSRLLTGVTFQFVSPLSESGADSSSETNDSKDWKDLLAWVRRSHYDPAAYEQLEAALQRQGHSDLADQTYKSMQQDSVSQPSITWHAHLKNIFLHYSVGYGRDPEYAVYWSLAVIGVGWLVFRPRKDVEPRHKDDASRPYEALWYSVDLFLPLRTLGAADLWMPRQSSYGRRLYARIHTILGWILIPIGLAAVTGILSAK